VTYKSIDSIKNPDDVVNYPAVSTTKLATQSWYSYYDIA